VSRYTKGQVVEVVATFYADDTPTDPSTVVFKVKRPNGTVNTYTYGVGTDVTRVEAGVFSLDITCDQSGEFWYRAEGTGMVKDAFENYFVVDPSRF
jgi:hypothetical protein